MVLSTATSFRVLVTLLVACVASSSHGAFARPRSRSSSGFRADPAEVAEGLAYHKKLLETQRKDSASEAFNCSIDLTGRMPPCVQATQSWCWATSITELSYFYEAVDPAKSNCSHTECSVVSADLGQQCCPVGSSSYCDFHGAAGIQEVATVASKFVGRPFLALKRPLSESELAGLLMGGKPVIMVLHWHSGGGHVMVIGGCKPPVNSYSGKALFAVHDPETEGWSWNDYHEVIDYSGGSWVSTTYVQ